MSDSFLETSLNGQKEETRVFLDFIQDDKLSSKGEFNLLDQYIPGQIIIWQ